VQRYAFWWLDNKNLTFNPPYSQKNPVLGPNCKLVLKLFVILTVLDWENFLPLVAIALFVVTNSNYVCNSIGLMLENISSSHVWYDLEPTASLPSEVINVLTVSTFATKLHTCNLTRYLLGRV